MCLASMSLRSKVYSVPHPSNVLEKFSVMFTDNQFIQTDPTNILIRSLTLKKAKGDSKDKERIKSATDSNKGKRPAERVAEDKIVAKRVNMGSGASSSRKEGGLGSLSDKDIQGYTVEKLRLLLKERNLPRTGKKEELIARLKQSI